MFVCSVLTAASAFAPHSFAPHSHRRRRRAQSADIFQTVGLCCTIYMFDSVCWMAAAGLTAASLMPMSPLSRTRCSLAHMIALHALRTEQRSHKPHIPNKRQKK